MRRPRATNHSLHKEGERERGTTQMRRERKIYGAKFNFPPPSSWPTGGVDGVALLAFQKGGGSHREWMWEEEEERGVSVLLSLAPLSHLQNAHTNPNRNASPCSPQACSQLPTIQRSFWISCCVNCLLGMLLQLRLNYLCDLFIYGAFCQCNTTLSPFIWSGFLPSPARRYRSSPF